MMYVPSKLSNVGPGSENPTGLLSNMTLPQTQLSDTLKNCLEHENIRIIPPSLTFTDAFEGKKYKQNFVIQNCGDKPAFIRICPPSASAFIIKTLVRGKSLSPGLRITVTVTYVFQRTTACPLAWIPIYINEKQVDYKLIVTVSTVVITAVPQQLDFEKVDAGTSPPMRTILLRNDGCRAVRFAIDLGRNELELTIEPIKGLIQPKASITLRAEMIGAEEGTYLKEFWIKCENPLRIPVKATVIAPKLQAFHPNTTVDSTLVDFPKTYFGAKCIRTLVIRNISAIPAMYCLLGQIENTAMNIQEAQKLCPDYDSFNVASKEGRLQPYESRIFSFVYKPIAPKQRYNTHFENYSFCVLRIVRVEYMDMTELDFPELKPEQDITQYPLKEADPSSTSVINTADAGSLSLISLYANASGVEVPVVMPLGVTSRIYLHGEAEIACVNIRPTSLELATLKVNQHETRELQLSNQSQDLSIGFRYKKVCWIEVKPKYGVLKPSEKVEVEVIITPTKFGVVKTNITFDLLFPNQPKEEDSLVIVGKSTIPVVFNAPAASTTPQPKFNLGITPKCGNEVGFMTDDVEFGSSVQIPPAALVSIKMKTLQDGLIAFPNDRPQTLRSRVGASKYRSIFTGIPRVDRIKAPDPQLIMRENAREFYNEYLRQAQADRSRKMLKSRVASEYDLSQKSVGLVKAICKPNSYAIRKYYSPYISLTPNELHNIIIKPKLLKLGKVVPNTTKNGLITIRNGNNFAITVFIKPRKSIISSPEGDRKLVPPNEETTIKLIYNAPAIMGKCIVIISVIINDNHIFEVTSTAEVKPKCVRVTREDIIFEPRKTNVQFVDVCNPLNIPVSFSWLLPMSCYTVEPSSGWVAAKRRITSMVTFTPHPTFPLSVELNVTSVSGINKAIRLTTYLSRPHVVVLNNDIHFPNLPLNLPTRGTVVLKNFEKEEVCFVVVNPKPINGIEIFPEKGLIHGYSEYTLDIHVKLTACIAFKVVIQVQLQVQPILEFTISGNVIYPSISVVPEYLKFRKIEADSFDHQTFTVKNTSQTIVTIGFLMKNYEEYVITETANREPAVNLLTLAPSQQKQLFIHFYPDDVASCYLFLPMIVNGIVGPPLLGSAETELPGHYLNSQKEEYLTHEGTESVQLPKKLAILKMQSRTVHGTLRFSKLRCNFIYFPHEKFNSITSKEFHVTNNSKEESWFCIRIDDVAPPFVFSYLRGKEIEENEFSYVCRLEPGEEVVFQINFNPSTQGSYKIKLPFFVRHYLNGRVFNFLTLTGLYPYPKIEAPSSIIYFEPVPLRVKTEQYIFLQVAYHAADCSIQAVGNGDDVIIEFSKEVPSEKEKIERDVAVLLTYTMVCSKAIDSSVTFLCTCGAECNVRVKGVAENSIFTTHAFLETYIKVNLYAPQTSATSSSFHIGQSFKEHSELRIDDDHLQISSMNNTIIDDEIVCGNDNSYPLFPDEYDESEYAKHMRTVRKVVEDWVFHQAFSKKYYFSIPRGFAALFTDFQQDSKEIVLTYVQLLIRLAGPAVLSRLPKKNIPNNDLDRICIIYSTYSCSKKFIEDQGGFLVNVHPEHLLEYSDYVTFCTSVLPEHPELEQHHFHSILEEKVFYRMSKQSWLDLLLQTYKVLILVRIESPPDCKKNSIRLASFSSHTKSETRKQSVTSQNCTINEEFWGNLQTAPYCRFWIYNSHLCILLQWLEYHYNSQRQVLWSKDKLPLGEVTPDARKIDNFGSGLSDGLVFAAVTAAHCKYLIPYLKDLYLFPISTEQSHHNACKLVDVWSRVNLSFAITPQDIINPIELHMAMLAAYLFEVLPSLFPNEVVNMNAELTKTSTKSVLIQNKAQNLATYSVLFFGNELECFKVASKTVTVPRGKTGKVQITFQAKTVESATAFLILSGENRGNTYAESHVLTLIGESDSSVTTSAYTVPVPLYQSLTLSVPIKSPYETHASYEIYYTYHVDKLKVPSLLSWRDIKSHRLPRRVYSYSTTLETNEDGVGTLEVLLTRLFINTATLYIFFLNREIGDFNIKVVLETDTRVKNYTMLDVPLPRSFAYIPCKCRKFSYINSQVKKCQRFIDVKIPCRNGLMWKTIAEMLTKTLDDSDKEFWMKYLDTNAGMHIMEWNMTCEKRENNIEIARLFMKTVEYEITQSSCDLLTIPSHVIIENVLSPDSFDFLIHINPAEEDELPESAQFTMKSSDGKEVRDFQLNFINSDNLMNIQ